MQILSYCLLSLPHTRAIASKINVIRLMASEQRDQTSYKVAIETLNTLQSFGKRTKVPLIGDEKLKAAESWLGRIGIQIADIDKLNPIHVAGTKGKGSVSAMCESILRAKGYKTGFFSSPHLFEVRERFRVNGRPISKELFVKYFWEVFNKLEETVEVDGSFPRYFAFLCLLSYQVFIQEKVDVAVIEVGIGGSYDSTNIIRHPKVCAITSLGYDHTDILGNTLSEIAWHKSGIFKPGSPAVTAPQTTEALEVIRERAKELGSSSLFVSPQYTSYPNHVTSLGIDGDHQFINASLAVQVCKSWLNEMNSQMNGGMDDQLVPDQYECGIPVAKPFLLSPEFVQGLGNCKWPGRCQVIDREGVSYYLDTAHTNRSIKYCSEWFNRMSSCRADNDKNRNKKCVRVLVFHFSGKRDASFLMDPLLPLEFQYAAFCPNIIDSDDSSTDYTNLTVTPDQLVPRARENALLWKQLHDSIDGVPQLPSEPLVFESISKAIQWIHESVSQPDTHVQVLVCGSTFLVGGVMKYLGYDADTL